MSNEIYSQITGRAKILCKRRDTFDMTIEVVHTDDTPHDITVYTELLLQVKKSARDDDSILDFSKAGGEITEESVNSLRIKKDSSDMDIPYNTYWYDLQGTKADGTVVTLGEGSFEVTSDISNTLTP